LLSIAFDGQYDGAGSFAPVCCFALPILLTSLFFSWFDHVIRREEGFLPSHAILIVGCLLMMGLAGANFVLNVR
jgi:hypothetical protein